uniref:Uncharacterized protein LOC104227015 n=1 Tax=Nicotiana sylvestris TaxID=4096 RepID=A0A1U7WBT2_NICSY|nr:PREDICTED: uncharacterized protein LOC104227015 [Nicotiana sylvestris]
MPWLLLQGAKKGGNAPTSSQRKLVDEEKAVQEEEIPNNVEQSNDEVQIDIDDSVEETQEEVNPSRDHIVTPHFSNPKEINSTLMVLQKRKKDIGWTLTDIRGISPAFCMHKVNLEKGTKPSIDHQRRLNEAMQKVVKKEIIKWFDAGVVYPISNSSWAFSVQCVPKKRGMTVVTNVFMDDFSVFENSFDDCRANLDEVLARFEETTFVLNWKKCPFMVEKGIVLGHKISKNDIEVNKEKFEVISKVPPPTSVKGVQSFLGHTGFYRCFIKDFSKLVNQLCKLLEKDAKFHFNDDCIRGFELLKFKLTTTPIFTAPN